MARLLAASGITVGPMALGAMNFGGPTGADEAFAILDAAVDAGLVLVDTAESYHGGRSEEIVGAWLRRRGTRPQVSVATKTGFDRAPTPEGVRAACEASLARLGVDHVDLYQLHRPWPDVPAADVVGAFGELVDAGLARAVGCSTHPAWMVVDAAWAAATAGAPAFVSEQPPYNLLDRRIENELVPACRRLGMAILPWSPLAGGILAGRYGLTEPVIPEDSRAAGKPAVAARVSRRAIEAAGRVDAIARGAGLTPVQLALAWVRAQPGITAPIVGPRRRAQLDGMLAALDVTLGDDLLDALDQVVPPGSAVADFHNSTNGWMRQQIID